MKSILRFILVAFLATVLPAAAATPQLYDATGLWIDPNESGWGLNIFHQGTSAFGALFVYGPDGKARWYIASNLVDYGNGTAHDRPYIIAGALHEATGRWFGDQGNTGVLGYRNVGDITLDVTGGTAYVALRIDGVLLPTKTLRRFTFRRDDLTGSYVGHVMSPAGTGPESRDEISIAINDASSTLSMTTNSWARGPCLYQGDRGQSGDMVSIVGRYSCTNGGSGPWSMSVDLTADGFVGRFFSAGFERIAASRTTDMNLLGNGWRTDLWFPANEPGWGVNIVEQGDTIFATLFVYDTAGRPAWYSASALNRSPITSDGTFVFTGPLHESTGPDFATSFNPSAVTRRQVGTMSFEVTGANTATLWYSVDGINVKKTVSRFAFRQVNLTGSYYGHQVADSRDAGGGGSEAMTIDIDDGFTSTRIRTSAASGSCVYDAPVAQFGAQRILIGTYSCTNGRSGPFTMSNVLVAWDGFTASFQGNGIANGHVEGVRRERN